jgi:hypothetical protein
VGDRGGLKAGEPVRTQVVDLTPSDSDPSAR